jgi:hypothetical protein
MLYREIIAEIRTKHTNTLCGQNSKYVSAKPGSTGNHWTLKG